MEKYLPEVKRSVAASMAKNMSEVLDDDIFLKTELDNISKVNPLVVEFIVNYAKRFNESSHAIYCGIMVYKLLYSQAEANEMNESI